MAVKSGGGSGKGKTGSAKNRRQKLASARANGVKRLSSRGRLYKNELPF